MAWFVDTSTRRWRWGRIRALTALVVAALAWVYIHDESPPDDADMRIAIPRIPDAENGMAQLGKLYTKALDFDTYAAAHGVKDTDAYNIIEGLARNDTVVDAFLASVAPALPQVDALLALPHFEVADNLSFKTFEEGLPEELHTVITVDRVLYLRAQRRAQAGDYAGAVDDVLRLRHLAQRFGEGHLTQLHWYMAMSLNGSANFECFKLLNDPALPVNELGRLAQAWSAEMPWSQIYQRSVRMEYQLASNTLDDEKLEDYYQVRDVHVNMAIKMNRELFKSFNGTILDAKTLEPSTWDDLLLAWRYYTLQRNSTRRLILGFDHREKSVLDGTYASRPPRPSSSFDESGFVQALRIVLPNSLGRQIATELAEEVNEVAESGFRAIMYDRLVRAGLALRQFYNDHQKLPLSLTALVPQYLAAVPTDPFDGQPLRYDPARALVYSVGKDLSDHHGSKQIDELRKNPVLAKLEPTAALDDDKQPTLELKFAQKPAAAALPGAR